MDVVPFDRADFQRGILTAMGIGTPARPAERVTFVFADTTANTAPADDEGVPFDPRATPTVTAGNRQSVLCAVEYLDTVGTVVDLGVVVPSQLRLTLLDAQYQQIKGFDRVEIGSGIGTPDVYHYRRTEPPIGMVTETVWTIYCRAEDDA